MSFNQLMAVKVPDAEETRKNNMDPTFTLYLTQDLANLIGFSQAYPSTEAAKKYYEQTWLEHASMVRKKVMGLTSTLTAYIDSKDTNKRRQLSTTFLNNQLTSADRTFKSASTVPKTIHAICKTMTWVYIYLNASQSAAAQEETKGKKTILGIEIGKGNKLMRSLVGYLLYAFGLKENHAPVDKKADLTVLRNQLTKFIKLFIDALDPHFLAKGLSNPFAMGSQLEHVEVLLTHALIKEHEPKSHSEKIIQALTIAEHLTTISNPSQL